MLLRASGKDAADELEFRRWLVENFGEADERELSEWVWVNHGRNGVHYTTALQHIVLETHKRGKGFVHGILQFLRELDPSVRESIWTLAAWFHPRMLRAVATMQRHAKDPTAVEAELTTLRGELRAEVHRLWPAKHRATIDGALLGALKYDPRFHTVAADYVGIAMALSMPDPLETNAKASWA